MSYRFQRVFTNYPDYLRQFYARRPALAAQPYAEQLAAHLYNAVERSDSYSVTLQTLGVETNEVIADAEPMQRQWAREHDLSTDDDRWLPQIALAQIEAFRPEVLFLNTWLPAFDAAFVRDVRARCPSVRMVIGWVGSAHPGAAYFAEHDLLLSCAPDTVAHMRAQGVNARHLHHGFDPRVLDRLADAAAPAGPVDVGFVGHVYLGQDYHDNRARMFDAIAQALDFTLYGELPGVVYAGCGPKRWLRDAYYAALGALHHAGLDRLARRLPRYATWVNLQERAPWVPVFERLAARARPPVFGLEMFRALAGFRICLNAHGPSAYASNLRLYEATGVGTCLLTDWKDNLPELFEPGVEVATYRTPEEAVEKARYLLEHDADRRAMAAAGQRRTLRDHTTIRRAERLHDLITGFLRAT